MDGLINLAYSALSLVRMQTEDKELLEDSTKKSEYSFYKQNPIFRKSLIGSGLAYASGSLFTFGAAFAQMAALSPAQTAAAAAISPPVLNTAIFAVGTVYQAFRLANVLLSKSPYEKDTPSDIAWQNNRRLEMKSIGLALACNVFFLATTLVPIPGVSNSVGLGVLGVLVVTSAVKSMVQKYNTKAAAIETANKSAEFQDSFADRHVKSDVAATVSNTNRVQTDYNNSVHLGKIGQQGLTRNSYTERTAAPPADNMTHRHSI